MNRSARFVLACLVVAATSPFAAADTPEESLAKYYRKKNNVPAQAKVLEQTLLQYNGMQLGIFQLLQARREQLDIDLAYVETLREYWTARAALDAVLSGRQVGSATLARTSAEPTTGSPDGAH